MYETVVGRRSLTNVAIVSIRGLTSKELVRRLKQRLAEIDIDGMVSPASVEEYVTGSRATPFPLIQYTERTDKFCQGLLDGRVGLLVDGLPQGYLLPVNIGYLMQTPEDRGVDYISGTCVRCIRYLAAAHQLAAARSLCCDDDVSSGDDPRRTAAVDHREQESGPLCDSIGGPGVADRF